MHAYWGIHASRAAENFSIFGQSLGAVPELIRALAWVKKASAHANAEFRVIDRSIAEAICRACDEIAAGHLHDQFIVDVIQGGAKTSTNMNANEVIANRALELLGGVRGDYDTIHPGIHVNASQSANDVYSTAWRLAAWFEAGQLLDAMASLRESFAGKAFDSGSALMMTGTTQLQDAAPMTLGRELRACAAMIQEVEARLRQARQLMLEITLGATAIGTGVNVPTGYAERAVQLLAAISSVPVVRAPDMAGAMRDTRAFLQISGVLQRLARKLGKTCNELGKVNTVIPEMVNQVAFEVVGNDVTITMASEAGPLELNPIIGWSLFKSIRHLTQACVALNRFCVDSIVGRHEVLERRVAEWVTVATASTPVIGYERGPLATLDLRHSGTIPFAADAPGIHSDPQLKEEMFVPARLTEPRRLRAGRSDRGSAPRA
jgi:aspartate ammonia-lyase